MRNYCVYILIISLYYLQIITIQVETNNCQKSKMKSIMPALFQDRDELNCTAVLKALKPNTTKTLEQSIPLTIA